MFSHQTLLAQSPRLSSLLYQEQYVLGLIAAAIATRMQAWTMPYINGDQLYTSQTSGNNHVLV